MFETLTPANGKLPAGILSGVAAPVTGNLDLKMRELAREVNEHNMAPYAAVSRILDLSDLKAPRQAAKDTKKRSASERPYTIAKKCLELEYSKTRDLAEFAETAVLMGEEPVAVAKKLMKQALQPKADIYGVYPITGAAGAIYRTKRL